MNCICGNEIKFGEKCSCGITVEKYPDAETPVSIYDDALRVDWYRAGEGYWGDYNPANPDDEELLRFDVYKKVEDFWEEVDDASYCTTISAETSPEKLVKPLFVIFKEYKDVDLDSCKKLGEALSWITLGD